MDHPKSSPPSSPLSRGALVLSLTATLLATEQGVVELLNHLFDLRPEAAAQGRRRRRKKPAQVEIASFTEGAEVYIDGELVGTIPLDGPIEVEPGEHVVKVSKPGYVDYYETHTFKRGRRPTVIEADLLPFSGILIIHSIPAGAQVIVDGSFVGETPFEGEIEGGQRTLTLKAPGFLPHQETKEIVAGETYFFDLTLKAEPKVVEEAAFYTTWWFWTGVAVVLAGGTATAIALSGEGTEPTPTVPVDGTVRLPLRVDF